MVQEMALLKKLEHGSWLYKDQERSLPNPNVYCFVFKCTQTDSCSGYVLAYELC